MDCWWCSLRTIPWRIPWNRQGEICPLGSLEAFPQLLLWTEEQHREQEGSKGKSDPAQLITQAAKPPGGDIRAGVFLLASSSSSCPCPVFQCRAVRAINPIFAGGDVASLGTAACVGLVHAPGTVWYSCLIINLFFDKELARQLDIQLWLPLDGLNQPKSAWIC